MKKGVVIVFVLLFLAGCSNEDHNHLFSDFKDKISQGVNLWTTVNYDIVKDKQMINEIDKPLHPLETPIMVRVFVETVNKGNQSAESIKIRFNEPAPTLHKNSRSFGGVTNGTLDKDKSFEYYFTYTFTTEAELDSFITHSSVSVTWAENQVNKEIKINLPSKPNGGNQ